MAVDSDNSISLPTPPPPRPAARRDAIEAALRRFDGIEDGPAKRAGRSWWASNQRQLGALATAAIIAIVSIPVALTVLEEQPRPAASDTKVPPTTQPRAQFETATPVQPPPAQSDDAATPNVPRSRLPLEPHEPPPTASGIAEQKAADVAEPLPVAAAAPPPPPPPAPAPERNESADEASAENVIVTGSRVAEQRVPSSQHGRLAAKRAADALKIVSPMDAYVDFLPRLQNAIRSGNPRAVSALVQYPLRVSTGTGPRSYPDRQSVEKNFGQIFTPRVRAAILAQRADQLFVRDQGAMIGDGAVWFDQTCRNSDCSQVGPVRIKAVNP